MQHAGELDLLDAYPPLPLGLIPKAVLERPLGVLAAEIAARETEAPLSLADALDLTLLIREANRPRYKRAAVRWLERFIQERRPTLTNLATSRTSVSLLSASEWPLTPHG